MTRFSAFLSTALVLVMTACAQTTTPTSTITSEPAATLSTLSASTSTTSTTSTTTTPSTTTSVAPAPVLGLISPSGVPVAVLEESEAGFVVLTPCGNETRIGDGERLHGTSVVIDPGHGGSIDTGAVGSNGLAEKDINLKVASAVRALLEARQISVVLTRTGDYTTPLEVRAHLADTLQADLMVSIHHNSPTPGPSSVPGVVIFIQRDSPESMRLGGLLWEHSMTGLEVFEVAWTAPADAGVMTVLNTQGDDAYGIIRHPDTPTALIELGYISNRAEAELYETAIYARVAAKTIADAIETYLTSDQEGDGFVEGRVFNPQPGVGKDVCVDPDLG